METLIRISLAFCLVLVGWFFGEMLQWIVQKIKKKIKKEENIVWFDFWLHLVLLLMVVFFAIYIILKKDIFGIILSVVCLLGIVFNLKEIIKEIKKRKEKNNNM